MRRTASDIIVRAVARSGPRPSPAPPASAARPWLLLLPLAAAMVSACDGTEALIDADGDGFYRNSPNPDLVDCDDDPRLRGALVYPGAQEVCNGIDDNCDGVIDGPEALGTLEYWPDEDGDGYGKDEVTTGCPTEVGLVRNNLDCSDISERINPDADEICDGIDNDCDGAIDDADDNIVGARVYYTDADGDGYGNVLAPVLSCDVPAGAVTNSLDCDDDIEQLSPETVWYLDADWDGHGRPDVVYPRTQCNTPIGYAFLNDDCDDNNPREFTTKAWYADADRDGFGFPTPVAQGCNPHPEWVDNPNDCDDRNFDIKPTADEICDTIDNNCDNAIDDEDPQILGQSVWYRDDDNDGAGRFYATVLACFQPPGYADRKGDCNDEDPTIDDNPQWHLDADRDGYGDPAKPYLGPNTCERVAGHVPNADDCDDTDFYTSPRQPWFVDADGDGVGAGFVSTVRACVNPNPTLFAPEGGDCDDNDPLDDLGGCYGTPAGQVGLHMALDNDTAGLEIVLNCAGQDVFAITFDAVDAGLTVEREAEVPFGALCVPQVTPPPGGDASSDGGPVVQLIDCGVVTALGTPFVQASECQGCTDPDALNFDPDARVSQDVCYHY